jgi:hypothetical protein
VVIDTDDPQKGRWGGQSDANGFVLTATVTQPEQKGTNPQALTSNTALWLVTLRVAASQVNGRQPQGPVRFHLHPTYLNTTRDVEAVNGVATLELFAWGASTVGAEVFNPVYTKLELDLAAPEVNAPDAFKQR